MNPAALIPTPDVLPVPWGWFQVLLLLTLFLHILLMNVMLGTAVIALVNLAISGTPTLSLIQLDGARVVPGDTFDLFTYSGTVTGLPATWNFVQGGGGEPLNFLNAQVLDDLAGTVYLTGVATVIPEPSTLAMLGLGAFALRGLGRKLRRRDG